jgi:hypothetical protein
MDDELAAFARRHRTEAAASLVATIRDPNATASSRTQAATKLLEYADGRPGQAKPLTVADLASMSDDERSQLFHALVTHYCPDGIQSLIKAAVDEALAKLPTAKFGFRRGEAKTQRGKPTATVQSSTERAQQAQAVPVPQNAPRPAPPAHASPAQPTDLPPPRSPQHSPLDLTKPTHLPNGLPIRRIGDAEPHPEGSQGSDHWTQLLNGYNAAKWRNGGNGHGH